MSNMQQEAERMWAFMREHPLDSEHHVHTLTLLLEAAEELRTDKVRLTEENRSLANRVERLKESNAKLRATVKELKTEGATCKTDTSAP